MKKSLNISMAALLAIAMSAALNVSELDAQVRSSASRSSQNTRSAARSSQMDSRNGATQNRNSVTQNKIDDRSGMGGQISNKDQAKMDKKQDKVDRQQMPTNINRQPDLNHQVEMARGSNTLPVPYRPERKASQIGMHPKMAPVHVFTPAELRLRTNATRIVVYTNFFTKAEAYAYVSRMMADRYYDIDTYDTSYGWFNTSMTVIPTPNGWADPFAANQFSIRFDFKRSGTGIKIYVTAQWRESMLGRTLYNLRFQPSDRYSTYYAWNILEDIAFAIPNYRVSFQ